MSSDRCFFHELIAARNGDRELMERVANIAADVVRYEFSGLTSLVQLARRMRLDVDVDEVQWADGLQCVLSMVEHPRLKIIRPGARYNPLQAAIVWDPTA